MFFKKLVDKRNGKVKFDNILKTNEEYKSVTYGCIRFIYSYQFLSSSLDKLFKTLVDNSHKRLKDLEDEVVDNDEILNIVSEINKIFKKDRYNNNSIKDIKKVYTNDKEKTEEALLRYIAENNPIILKTKFPDSRNI